MSQYKKDKEQAELDRMFIELKIVWLVFVHVLAVIWFITRLIEIY